MLLAEVLLYKNKFSSVKGETLMSKIKSKFKRIVSIVLFICTIVTSISFPSIQAKADINMNYNNGLTNFGDSELTVNGYLRVKYHVGGYFEENHTTGMTAHGTLKADKEFDIPVKVKVYRTYINNGKDVQYYSYETSITGTTSWEGREFTLADQLDDMSMGSDVVFKGTASVNIPEQSEWHLVDEFPEGYDYDDEVPIERSVSLGNRLSMKLNDFYDVIPEWSVTYQDIKVSPISATLHFTMPSFRRISVDWDDGVEKVQDEYAYSTKDKPLVTFEKKGNYYFTKGTKSYTYITLKEGYDLDYIGEGSNDYHWNDSTWNSTENRWENSWTMNNNRDIYIHTKKQIKTLNLSWDSGVNMVIGHSTEGSDMQMPNGGDVGYYYGTTAPAWIYLDSGYDIDYIEDLDSHEKIYVSSSDWNEDNSRYDKYFEMKQNRKLKIHTKLNTFTLTIDPNYGTMYNGSEETSSKFTTKFVYGRKTYMGNLTASNGFTDNVPTREGYTFAGWKFSNGTGGLSKLGEKFYFSDTDMSYSQSDYSYIFNGDYAGDVTATAQWKSNTYLQEVYMRFQNEDGSWSNWDAWDRYSYASKEEYDDHFGNPLSSIVSDGSEYTFDTSMITDDFRWSDSYKMPEQFDDGTPFTYTVTGSKDNYISVCRKNISYNQDIYVRYQNEDGSWGDYSDRYWHISTDEAPNGYWEYFRWTIDNGSPFWFGLDDIKQDSKWDDTLYEFPDTFADGSSLSYTVTGESKKYVDIKRKQYTMNFNKGLTNSTATMSDVEKLAGDTYKIPLPKWLGRSYVITLDNDGSKTTISGNLTFDQWKGYKNIPFSEIKKDDTRYDWYSDGELLENIRYDITFIANWESEDVTLPTPTKEGYTFAGWKCNVDGKIYNAGDTYTISEDAAALNVTFTAQWTADTNTKYVVNHWKQNIGSDAGKHDSSNYTLAETYNLTGITDTPVTPAVKTYTGFTSPDVQTVNINGDGSTVVNYYYTRNKYKIDDGGNNDGTGSDDGSGDTGNDKGNGIKDITGGGEYYYEEEVSMEAVVKRGYHWHIDDDCHTDRSKYPTGWTVTKPGYGIEKFLDNTNYGTQKIRFVMPAHDVYVRADATNNSYTIEFERNGGTGNMPAIEATYAVPVTLPDNSFTKTTAFGNSTFLYWEDTKNDTTYDDKSVIESLTDEFNGTVILKAAWDDCPEITAQERWFTVDDSQNGKITLEELLSTAKVTDDRDSDIEEKLTVKYYQPNLFTQFKTDGYVMVTYTATDSSNNTTEVTVKVNIVDTVAVEQEKNTYARFIAPQYYKESYENGGLEDDSIWKKDPDYAAVLESAMNNRESMYYEYIETELYGVPFRIRKQACEYSDHLMEKWVFTKDDVKAVKEYVNEHGIGNLKEADALANFRIQFAHCRQQ